MSQGSGLNKYHEDVKSLSGMVKLRAGSDSAKHKFFLQCYHWERKEKITCGIEGGDGYNLVIQSK